MKKTALFLTCFFASSLLLTAHADDLRANIVGAQVDESHLSPIFVSASDGNDSQDGSAQKPFATIAHALDLARGNLKSGIGTRIVLQPGIYRETGLSVDGSALGGGGKKTTLVIEASENGGVEWKGSEICTVWECVDAETGLYRTPWNRSQGDTELSIVPSQHPGPSAPQSLTIRAEDGAQAITLQWTSPTAGKSEGYSVERATYSDTGKVLEEFHALAAPMQALSHTDRALPPAGAEFRYRVAAISQKSGSRALSNQVRASWILRYIPNQLGRRNEMVFIDGRKLRQVSRREELTGGTFWIEDEIFPSAKDSKGSYLYIRLGSQKNPAQLSIEVAGGKDNPFLLAISNKSNFVLKGIDFSQAPSRSWNGSAVIIAGGSQVLVENNSFHENNDVGISVTNIDHLTFRGNTFLNNGGGGVNGNGGGNQIWEDNLCSGNGWRSTVLGGQEVWFSAGIKHGFGLRNSIFRKNVMQDNACLGFWLDTDMENILIEDLSCIGNSRSGMWLEGSHGPCIVRDSVFRKNGDYGLLLGDAGGITLENNEIEDNDPAQISVAVQKGPPPGRAVVDRDNGATYQSDGKNISWINNTIAARKPDQMLVAFNWGDLASYQTFLDGFHGRGNRYWHPSGKQVFASPIFGRVLKLSLEEWSRLTGKGSPQDTAESGTRWQRPENISPSEPTTSDDNASKHP